MNSSVQKDKMEKIPHFQVLTCNVEGVREKKMLEEGFHWNNMFFDLNFFGSEKIFLGIEFLQDF